MKDRERISTNRAGFTLLEVSLAITLMALLAMIVYGAFYLGSRAIEKAQARGEESHRVRVTGELLGGYIRSAHPYRPPGDPTPFFWGEEHSVTFVSAISVGMGGRGMSRVTIAWESGGGLSGDLILEEELPVRFDERGRDGAYRNRVVLRQAVQDVRFEYLSYDAKSNTQGWVGEWNGKERKALPRAVRVSYHGIGGAPVEWVFPVMMSVLVS